eukprot:SAG11_NODE_1869_length_4151_cov_5.154245_4_plen_114_part_00
MQHSQQKARVKVKEQNSATPIAIPRTGITIVASGEVLHATEAEASKQNMYTMHCPISVNVVGYEFDCPVSGSRKMSYVWATQDGASQQPCNPASPIASNEPTRPSGDTFACGK